MKNLDNFTKRFVAISLSIMGLFLCATLFFATINRANAGNNATGFSPTYYVAPSSGNIMMDYTSVYVPSEDKTYYECLVWDKSTGYSRLYYYNYTDKKFKAYDESAEFPLPSFSTETGEVMMDYSAIHVPTEEKTYYECMMWNTATGVSELYYYNYTDKRFKKYESNVQLPTSPLE